MRHRLKLSVLCAALIAAAAWQTSAQQGGAEPVSAGRESRTGQQGEGRRSCRRGEPGRLRRLELEIRPRLQRAGRSEAVESGEDQTDAGRQGRRRHGRGRHRSASLLRDGERRLRLHLDRDAALSRRCGTRSCARGKPVRTRRPFPACASPMRTSRRSSTRSIVARSCSSCRPSIPSGGGEGRREVGATSRRWDRAARAAGRPSIPRCGATFPAAIARRSTTIS